MVSENVIKKLDAYERSVAALRGCLHGRVVRPGDADYDEVRLVHSGTYQREPSLIVQAADVADVITAVNFARDQELPVAVRSGGHSLAGYSTTDGIVIDLTQMKSIDVDPERRTLRVGAGATSADVLAAAQPHGLALPTGDTSSVGMGGLTTGGGVGWLVRKYGLTIDRLLAADVVTADGRLLRASADQNADLFWGIRGGGGNFGIVTAFEFEAVPVDMVLGGAIFYDAREGREVLRRYADYAREAPEALTTIVFIMNAPPLPFIPPAMHGKLVIAIGLVYAGDLEEGQRVVDPLRALGTPVADATAPMPYPDIYMLTDAATVMGHQGDHRSTYMYELPDEANDTILRHLENMSSPTSIGQLRVLGGAMARVPADATAFSHRDKPFLFTIITVWDDPAESPQHHAWTRRFWEDLRPHGEGVYVNFLDREGEDRIREAYGDETYRRLVQLKNKYDPTNFFRLNQNIQPAVYVAEEASAA